MHFNYKIIYNTFLKVKRLYFVVIVYVMIGNERLDLFNDFYSWYEFY